jgi:membrane protein DedA with SNARE-associated domain
VTILISRFIPIVRHLISIPAGMASMKLVPFCAFTLLGAGLWNTFLTWCGFVLRNNWTVVTRYSHWIDIAVVVLLAGLIVFYVARHLLKRRR